MWYVHTSYVSCIGEILTAIFCSPANQKPVFQAIWADNRQFDEVLISKRMIQDHMPDKVLEALGKVQTQPN